MGHPQMGSRRFYRTVELNQARQCMLCCLSRLKRSWCHESPGMCLKQRRGRGGKKIGGKLVLRLRRTRRRGVNMLLSQKLKLVNLKQLVTAERRTQMMLKSLSKIGIAKTESVIGVLRLNLGSKSRRGR